MTKRSHQKCWRMKTEHLFLKRFKTFSMESEHFLEIGGELKQGHHCLRGMDAPDR